MKPCRQSLSIVRTAGLLLAVLALCPPRMVAAAGPANSAPPGEARPLAAPVAPPQVEPEAEQPPTPGRPPSLDSAFDFGLDLGDAGKFLLDQKTGSGPAATEWKQRIDMARKQRMVGEFTFAFVNLQEVLDGPAEESLKKTALLEMATTQHKAGHFHEALKTCGMYRKRYPQDAGLPHVLLFQGLLMRELGAPQAALAKFHAVLSATLNLNLDKYDYYRKLVLLAQAQIADTLYSQGQLDEAAEKYTVLLRDESLHLKKSMVRYRLLLCLEGLDRQSDLVAQAKGFLESETDAPEAPHVRYLLSTALKKLGRNAESLAQVKALLAAAADQDDAVWKAWKQRTGNEIANQLYRDGDYFNALNLYLKLAEVEDALTWQLPVWYQIGLIHERLDSPPEAIKAYQKILDREGELSATSGPALTTLASMARWRRDFIQWKFEADKARIQLQQIPEAPARTASKQ